jgi:hypothetical protein
MASEPVLSRDVGNRTSFVSQPVIVISDMVLMLSFLTYVVSLTAGFMCESRTHLMIVQKGI